MTDQWVHLRPEDLLDWRMENGLSRRQLSMHFRVSTATIRSYERGDEAPPEWLQDRMATTILAEEIPAVTVPRGRRRRYRWGRSFSSDTLFRWRKEQGLTQQQAAQVLGCSPASVSAWERNERAPKRPLQYRIRERVEGYDNYQFPPPVVDTPPTSTDQKEETVTAIPQINAANTEETVRRRAQTLMERVDTVKQPERSAEARWGREDGFVLIRSLVTGAHYLIDSESGRFFRTTNPKSTRITSDSPRGVVHEDRVWLYPLLERLPEGKLVVSRFHQGQAPTPTSTPTAAMIADPASQTPPELRDLKPTVESKRVVMLERTGKLTIRPDQLKAMLAHRGIETPDSAEMAVDNGYLILTWPLDTEVLGEEESAP